MTGRDHNPDGFTCWMMGAGVKGGAAIGAPTNLAGGRRAIRSPSGTFTRRLHILGLDHTRLTYYHNGLNRRLTDVHGNVLTGCWRDRSDAVIILSPDWCIDAEITPGRAGGCRHARHGPNRILEL